MDTARQKFHQLCCAASFSTSLFIASSLPAPATDLSATATYQVILERNPFDLRPSQPVVARARSATSTEFPEYRLTGISTLAGTTRAFLTREIRGQPHDYVSLCEGQQDGYVEAVWIHARAGAVLLRHSEAEFLLSFRGQEKAERAAELEEQRFNEEHERAHERYEAEERERERLELEEAERELARRTQPRS